jgi:predicted amidohydrolase YtcJ
VNRTLPPGYPYAEPHADEVSGSIEAGKAADLVVLDRNLFDYPAAEIALANIDLTIAGGRIVHD